MEIIAGALDIYYFFLYEAISIFIYLEIFL
uniref:Uncharacterized protein n=1 Tax=Arundo donax TaxID=35708 RepID=A0A0A9AJ36_ARUDO